MLKLVILLISAFRIYRSGLSREQLLGRIVARKSCPLRNRVREPDVEYKPDVPSLMYESCLEVGPWMRAKRYLTNSLSDTPIRACKRFLVSENFSPYSLMRIRRTWYKNIKNRPVSPRT